MSQQKAPVNHYIISAKWSANSLWKFNDFQLEPERNPNFQPEQNCDTYFNEDKKCCKQL